MPGTSLPEDWKGFIGEGVRIPGVPDESFPPRAQRFAAFEAVSPQSVRVVIVGQDPYHGEGQANGLAFSIANGKALRPSLRNIFKEWSTDLRVQVPPPHHGDLSPWAKEGVLLLNAALSVPPGRPGAHLDAWRDFFESVIKSLGAASEPPRVFMLWGKPAQQRAQGLIDEARHLVIRTSHPAPLSAGKGFFGSKPFSTASAWLEKNGRGCISWGLSP